MIVGFSSGAYLTFILVLIHYAFDYINDPFTNVIDRSCIAALWCKSRNRPSRIWEPFLRIAVLIYSDLELVTGIAILASAFPQLYTNIPTYYWQLAVYLAWFSTHTHLATLTILRQYLRDHPVLRTCRVALMLGNALLLAVALLPTGDRYWMADDHGHFIGGVPAICHFQRLKHASNFTVFKNSGFTMLVSLLILFFGYISRILKLSARASSFMNLWTRTKPGDILRRYLNKTHRRLSRSGAFIWWRGQYVMLETCLVLGRATLDAYESMLWEVCILKVPL